MLFSRGELSSYLCSRIVMWSELVINCTSYLRFFSRVMPKDSFATVLAFPTGRLSTWSHNTPNTLCLWSRSNWVVLSARFENKEGNKHTNAFIFAQRMEWLDFHILVAMTGGHLSSTRYTEPTPIQTIPTTPESAELGPPRGWCLDVLPRDAATERS